MNCFIKGYYNNLLELYRAVEVTGPQGCLDVYSGIEKVVALVRLIYKTSRKIMFVGNGASATISSHMATDFWKTSGVRSVCFNDIAALTSVSNDFSYEQVFSKPIEVFADNNDLLIAISSSGKSQNIIEGVYAAQMKKCTVITLSGKGCDNPLRTLGNINFYVPAERYGYIEVIHHSICHCILDTLMYTGHTQKPSLMSTHEVVDSAFSFDLMDDPLYRVGGFFKSLTD